MARILALLLIAVAPCMASAASPERLFHLINARLQLMHDVASYKWHHQVPIEDKARERLVLASAERDAVRHGIAPRSTVAFFKAQISAAKEIERFWFNRYKAGINPGAAPDLGRTIRPRLLALGNEITEALGKLHGGVSSLWQQQFMATVKVEGLSNPSKLAIFRALTGVHIYANRLQQILGNGELRVGTTGDYAPFSFMRGKSYTGIDIAMAKNLAAALGVRLVLVPTSWPHLMHDLTTGRYDIAMSGVTRNNRRERLGFFSTPYYQGGKAAIARCSDAARYSSLARIDRRGVRVIVNPGGTNAEFVKLHIKHAQVIVYKDNRKIFKQIAEGHADVMITDAIEVKLQAHRNKRLCATMAGKKLTYLDKAYLMPQDPALKIYVDNWLDLRRRDGTVRRVFDRFLARQSPPQGP